MDDDDAPYLRENDDDDDDAVYIIDDDGNSDSDDVISGAIVSSSRPDSALGKRPAVDSSKAKRAVSASGSSSRIDMRGGAFESSGDATPRTVVVRGSVGINDDETKQSLRRSFNQCPICKMPINVKIKQPTPPIPERELWDSRWMSVQAWFKSKPGVCMDDTKRMRTIQAFGTVPTIGKRTIAWNQCHYLHKSASVGTVTFNGIWHMCIAVSGGILKFDVNGFSGEQQKGVSFLRKLTKPESIFSLIGDLTHGFLFNSANINFIHLNEVLTTITIHTFAGCWDCNQRMTQMDFIPVIFERCLGDITYQDDAVISNGMKLNAQVNYILMAMQLDFQDLFETNSRPRKRTTGNAHIFQLEPAKQRIWRLQLSIAWCIMMIVFSHWNVQKLKGRYKHHEHYIYLGTADLYLSLLLYIVYVVNWPDDAEGVVLAFEEFHFVYTTNFVFYLKHRRYLKNTTDGGNSLSLAIHHKNSMTAPDAADGSPTWEEVGVLDIPKFDAKNPLPCTRESIKQIYEQTAIFVSKHFHPFCLQLYKRSTWGGATDNLPQFARFFTHPDAVEDLIRKVNASTPTLNIQEFVNVLGPAKFWYHFKHITMQQIAVACGESRTTLPAIFHEPFDRWCTSAFAKINALQSRLTLSLLQEHRLACKQEDEKEHDAGLLLCHGKMRTLTL